MQNLGLIELKQGQWVTAESCFKVPEKLGDESLQNYHRKSLLDAIEACSTAPQDRRYRSLILPLNQSEFDQLNEAFNIFAKEILGKFNADELQARRLFQLNYNIHSVSAPVSI